MFSPPTIRDDVDGSPILVKHAAGDDRHLLRREAKVLEAAAHLNVVRLRGLLELEDRSELMLTYVSGASLAEHPPLTFDALLDVALQLGDTLVELHELGIRHGAVTAEHLLINQNGRVLLCGFGNAEETEDVNSDILALADLLSSELARSEDAGLTTLQRRETAALQASIRLLAQNEPTHSNPELSTNPDLRRWLAHLMELAHTGLTRSGESAGSRKSSNQPRRWLSQRISVRHVTLTMLGLAVVVVLWQLGFSQSSPTIPASPTRAADGYSPAQQANTQGVNTQDKDGIAAGTDVNYLTTDNRPTGVLVTGLTPERCLDDASNAATNDSASPADFVSDAAATGLSTITAASDLNINADGCTEKIFIGTIASTGADEGAAQPAIATPTRRWLIGQSGDHVTVGDWNCDGIATPVVLRPTSGEVFFFAVWPHDSPPAQPTARASVPIGATGVSSSVNTADVNSAGVALGKTTNRHCHHLVVWFDGLSLTLSPNRYWSDAVLSHFSG